MKEIEFFSITFFIIKLIICEQDNIHVNDSWYFEHYVEPYYSEYMNTLHQPKFFLLDEKIEVLYTNCLTKCPLILCWPFPSCWSKYKAYIEIHHLQSILSVIHFTSIKWYRLTSRWTHCHISSIKNSNTILITIKISL